jgi:hypothetical protein
MGQIFRPNANLLARLSIFGGILLLIELILIIGVFFRSDYWRQVHIAIEQPVPFSHQIHADQLGLDCRYCHTSVAQSSYANIPPTETCMTCHSQIAANSTLLQPVRDSWATGEPVRWVKVHHLPEFVYFNHSIHVNKGVGCTQCHGQVNQMPVVWKEEALYMGWCLDCHRAPEKYLRPRDEVYNMDYVAPPPAEQRALGQQLVQDYNVNVRQLTNCAVCHR